MTPEEFVARGQRAQQAVDVLTPSPYRQALEFIERHPGTSGTNGLAKLLLSLWNGDCGFSFRECIQSLDETRTALAIACVVRFAARGEDSDLVDVGYRVHALAPRLWELGVEARDAKAALRAKWKAERERQLEDES